MEKKPPDFGMLDYKAKIGEGNTEKLMSELEYKLKEKKPPDLGILDYKAEIGEGDTEKLKYELESELEETKTPDFSMLGYNAKVLNKAGDMTADFFKTKVLICPENKFETKLDISAKTEFEGKERQEFGGLTTTAGSTTATPSATTPR